MSVCLLIKDGTIEFKDGQVVAWKSKASSAVLGKLAAAASESARQASSVSVELRQTIQSARGNFVTTPAAAMSQGDDRQLAEMIIKGALAESIRDILLLAIILTLGAAASGALLPRRTQLASIP